MISYRGIVRDLDVYVKFNCFSRTNRRAAYRYIKKNKGDGKNPYNTHNRPYMRPKDNFNLLQANTIYCSA